MAKTIKAMGLEGYLNDVYAKEGGFGRLLQLLELKWPKEAIAQEFKVDRWTIYKWMHADDRLKKFLEEEINVSS